MSWLDKFFKAYSSVQVGGVALAPETTINFVGATVVDDPTNARTTVTVTGGGGGTVPTGTGIPHIVGGVQSTAASLIVDADVTSVGAAKITGTLGVANGGTGLSALPGTTTQSLFNSAGALGATANVLSDGTISNGGYPIVSGSSANVYFGTTGAYGAGNQATQATIAPSTILQLALGSSTKLYFNNSSGSGAVFQFWAPIMGGYDAGVQSPLRVGVLTVTQSSTATKTLATTESCYPALNFVGTPGGAFSVVAPLLGGTGFDVYNGTPSTMTFGGSSGATVSIPTLTKARVFCFDGANYR